ncbi:MAG TPA: hypothetical protein VHH15_15235 [Actinophytocola sp.]|nr:hypothetical protein [Actinophytocola sp.]
MHQLTTPQRERLHRLVRRSPVFIGMRVEFHDDRVEVIHPEPVTLGFESLSALVAGTPADQWPDVVDGYLERGYVLATSEPPELDGPTEAVLERTYLRLMSTEYDEVTFPSYAEELVPGLARVFAFDLPDAILTMDDDRVHRHGFERLFDAGAENLCRELPDRYAENDGVVVLQGSDYVGSLVLVLPWVVEALTGDTALPHGALVAMPARDTLALHIVRDRAQVLRALEEMAALAAEWYAASTHGLSPRVYWCRTEPVGRIETIAHHDGRGVVTYHSEDFANTLYEVDREWQ